MWHPFDQLRLLWWLLVRPAALLRYLKSDHRDDLTQAGTWCAGALLLWPLIIMLAAALAGAAPPANSIAPYVMLLNYCLLVAFFVPTIPAPPPESFDEDFTADSLALVVALGLCGGLALAMTLLVALLGRGAELGVGVGLVASTLAFVLSGRVAGVISANIAQQRASWLSRALFGGLCGAYAGFVVLYLVA